MRQVPLAGHVVPALALGGIEQGIRPAQQVFQGLARPQRCHAEAGRHAVRAGQYVEAHGLQRVPQALGRVRRACGARRLCVAGGLRSSGQFARFR